MPVVRQACCCATGRPPEPAPRDFLERILTDPNILFWMVILLAGIWLATGIYVVNPGEAGIIRRFGKEVGQASPGLNYHLPWPIDQRNIVNTARIRRIVQPPMPVQLISIAVVIRPKASWSKYTAPPLFGTPPSLTMSKNPNRG